MEIGADWPDMQPAKLSIWLWDLRPTTFHNFNWSFDNSTILFKTDSFGESANLYTIAVYLVDLILEQHMLRCSRDQ